MKNLFWKRISPLPIVGIWFAMLSGSTVSGEEHSTADISIAKMKVPPLLHSFRWSHWRYGRIDNEVIMDNVVIGRGKEAALKLAAMKFQPGSYLELVLPKVPYGAFTGIDENDKGVSFFYEEENFLQKWIFQGVCLTMKANGKQLEVHTLTASDDRGKPLNPFYAGEWNGRETTGCKFVFDGKTYLVMEEAILAIRRAAWSDGSVCFVCVPKTHQGYETKRPNGIDYIFKFLLSRNVNLVFLPNALLFHE